MSLMSLMSLIHYLFQLFLLFNFSTFSWAQTSEKGRLSGFNDHKKEQGQFDTARSKAERAHLEEEEQWENQKQRNLLEYKKGKKQVGVTEDGPEAKADAKVKKKYVEDYEKNRQEYVQEKSKQQELSRKALNLPSENQELGLDEIRPRYDYRKRVLYGARPKYGKMPGSSGSSPGSSSFSGSPSPSFPPPPPFEDYGDGYVPAPNMPDDFGDIPPPPPPPGFGDEFGGSDSFPPPPPPPPPFEGDF